MASRKPRLDLPTPPQPKAVPYPPASIWKTKENGVDFDFRGNVFARRGDHVVRVFGKDKAADDSPVTEPKTQTE